MKFLLTALLFCGLSGAAFAQEEAPGGKPVIACNLKVVYDLSTNGATQLIPAVVAQNIYVCGYVIYGGGTVNVGLISGTQTTTPCDTSTVKETPAYQLTSQAGVVDNRGYGDGFKVATNTSLCINTSAGVAVQAIVYYTQH
jgi:hypothetical protein